MKTVNIANEQAQLLLEKAEHAKQNTYPEPGGYAAAVLTDTGEIITGGAYISDTFTLTMHGEAAALSHAAAHGHKNIVAITGPNCHICKQLIWESSLKSGIEIQVITKDDDQIILTPISKLMPQPWPDANGHH
jgi:cytidine deaminase